MMELPQYPKTDRLQDPKRPGAYLAPRLGIWVFGYLGLSLLLSGCGGDKLPLAKVSGTVTLDGAVLPEGIIHFMPQSGPAATGVIKNGKYRLSTYGEGDGAVLGTHTIYFAPASNEAHMAGYTEADYAAGKPPPEAPQQDFLPARYLTPSSSGLSKVVEAGGNAHDFPLTTQSQP